VADSSRHIDRDRFDAGPGLAGSWLSAIRRGSLRTCSIGFLRPGSGSIQKTTPATIGAVRLRYKPTATVVTTLSRLFSYARPHALFPAPRQPRQSRVRPTRTISIRPLAPNCANAVCSAIEVAEPQGRILIADREMASFRKKFSNKPANPPIYETKPKYAGNGTILTNLAWD
jgi:hypothetical protein